MGKRKEESEKYILTGVRVRKETLDEIKRLASEKRRRPSELMRLIMENYVEGTRF